MLTFIFLLDFVCLELFTLPLRSFGRIPLAGEWGLLLLLSRISFFIASKSIIGPILFYVRMKGSLMLTGRGMVTSSGDSSLSAINTYRAPKSFCQKKTPTQPSPNQNILSTPAKFWCLPSPRTSPRRPG